ncbi:MAG: hypothetical protein EBR67_07610 [Proteobacteria bacterium]|nr:hypothetical protein [Pseudomonadota bacterium]
MTIGSASGISTSGPIALKSGYLRIIPSQNAYIEVGASPGINTSTSIWVAANTELILKESVRSEPVVGIITGTSTTVIFPEGTGSAFEAGDYVELTGIAPSGINTTFAQVSSVDKTTSYNGYHNTRLVLNWNTSSQSAVTDADGELRKVTKIAAFNESSNPNIIHITEVQVVSNFS